MKSDYSLMPASTAASLRTEQLAQTLLKEMNQNGE